MPYALHVTLVNATKGWRYYDEVTDLEDFGAPDFLTEDGTPNHGAIFRAMRAEYGRCQCSVYLDQLSGETTRVGWVFVSRDKYDDCDESYLREAWVTIVERIPGELHTLNLNERNAA